MISPSSLCEIKDRIHTNDEKINLLNNINEMLKERHEIETNHNHLHLKFTQLQTEETERKEKYDCSRKHYLSEVENRGQELCKEHARMLHQIEHIHWHLEGCTRHRPCQGGSNSKKPLPSPSNASCISSSAPTCSRPSAMANLKNSSERLIKSIVDLRKKSFAVQEKLECEAKRKKEMEKKLSELRKEISRQKKSLSSRRNNSNASMATSQSSLSHCPAVSASFCSSLPPIKKPMMMAK